LFGNALPNDRVFSRDVVHHLSEVYGAETDRVLNALRESVRRYCVRVNTLKSDPKVVVERFRSRGILAESHRMIAEAVFLVVDGPFQMPRHKRRIVVDKFTAESVLLGAHVYAPGIAKAQGMKRGLELSIVDDLGQHVGNGIARMSETEVLTIRRGLAVELTDSRYRIPSLRETEEFSKGLICLQSFPSLLVSRILDPKPGETVVDLCASPGGKSSHIAQMMGDQGTVYAVDRNEEKVAQIRSTMARLGVKSVQPICSDSRYLDIDYPSIKADRVLVDPPCSAIGVRPKVYDFTRSSEIRALAEYQKQFVKVASTIVKMDGVVVYSTCTLTIEENEEIARYAVEKCGLELERQEPYVFGSEEFSSPSATFPTQRFHPHIHDTPGFFIARFRRTA